MMTNGGSKDATKANIYLTNAVVIFNVLFLILSVMVSLTSLIER